MRIRQIFLSALLLALLLATAALTACNRAPADTHWTLYGDTPDDHRYSTLNQIDGQSVSKLGLLWSHEMGTTHALEATPIEEDGVLYTTGSWSVVFAFDAKTGNQLWKYDPQVARDRAYFVCCDIVNRGVALSGGMLYLGTLDARLIALDKKTGTPVWTAMTAEGDKPYSITSAPRVAKNLVVIGNGGAEYGVRGYVTAYDADSGKQVWRTYTVPGDPSKPFESKALEAASKTWSGDYWKTGGGGPAWEGIVYDPDLDLLYFGTGNATAWYRSLRGDGPKADQVKDALYTASILAVHASSGELAWYFQTTPGENWDYDATEPLVQADLSIGGRARKVIMQANKNGFFYVLDRQTGEFISGAPFVGGVTWASGLDPKTGRPNVTPTGYDGSKAVLVSPSPNGGHNWQPIAFNPTTGYVYLAAKEGTEFVHAPNAKWKYDENNLNLGLDDHYDGPLNAKMVSMPPAKGMLLAWDPVNQRAAWTAPYPVAEGGGALTTAGNLVFQGRGDGIFAAYRATDGKPLWQFDAGTGILAPPITYSLGGVQYITLMVGWGGGVAMFNAPGSGNVKPGYGRMLTFALNGTATLKAPFYGHKEPPVPAMPVTASKATLHEGEMLYTGQCARCHGIDAVAAIAPDLRYLSKGAHDQFEEIVLGGARASAGMPSFKKLFTSAQVKEIQQYILSRAAESAKP